MRGWSLIRVLLKPTGGSCRIELIALTVTGVSKLTPPFGERATAMFASGEAAPTVSVGPRCHTT